MHKKDSIGTELLELESQIPCMMHESNMELKWRIDDGFRVKPMT